MKLPDRDDYSDTPGGMSGEIDDLNHELSDEWAQELAAKRKASKGARPSARSSKRKERSPSRRVSSLSEETSDSSLSASFEKEQRPEKKKRSSGNPSFSIKARGYLLLSVLLIAGSLYLLQRLVMPKYEGDVVEGNFIAEYYRQENKDHDVIFLGDCEVYENFSPQILWEEYGVNSYIRGSAQQLVSQSYYILEDTLKYEKPDVVVFSVLAVALNEPAKESYNRMTLDGMRWSASKIKAVQASMTEEESMMDYLFPLLRYHSRITELTSDDFTYLFHRDTVSHNGYYMRVDARAAVNVPDGKPLADYAIDETQLYWLEKIRTLCEENGISLMLVKAPSLYPYWYEQWDRQIAEYADSHGLTYVNLLNLSDAIGLDFSTDTYDGGLHLNLSGAEKLSHYFGAVLQEVYGLEDRRGETELAALWAENRIFYEEDRDRQLADMQE